MTTPRPRNYNSNTDLAKIYKICHNSHVNQNNPQIQPQADPAIPELRPGLILHMPLTELAELVQAQNVTNRPEFRGLSAKALANGFKYCAILILSDTYQGILQARDDDQIANAGLQTTNATLVADLREANSRLSANESEIKALKDDCAGLQTTNATSGLALVEVKADLQTVRAENELFRRQGQQVLQDLVLLKKERDALRLSSIKSEAKVKTLEEKSEAEKKTLELALADVKADRQRLLDEAKEDKKNLATLNGKFMEIQQANTSIMSNTIDSNVDVVNTQVGFQNNLLKHAETNLSTFVNTFSNTNTSGIAQDNHDANELGLDSEEGMNKSYSNIGGNDVSFIRTVHDTETGGGGHRGRLSNASQYTEETYLSPKTKDFSEGRVRAAGITADVLKELTESKKYKEAGAPKNAEDTKNPGKEAVRATASGVNSTANVPPQQNQATEEQDQATGGLVDVAAISTGQDSNPEELVTELQHSETIVQEQPSQGNGGALAMLPLGPGQGNAQATIISSLVRGRSKQKAAPEVPPHVQVEQSGENRAGNAGDPPKTLGQLRAKLQKIRRSAMER